MQQMVISFVWSQSVTTQFLNKTKTSTTKESTISMTLADLLTQLGIVLKHTHASIVTNNLHDFLLFLHNIIQIIFKSTYRSGFLLEVFIDFFDQLALLALSWQNLHPKHKIKFNSILEFVIHQRRIRSTHRDAVEQLIRAHWIRYPVVND